ncbi:MAG: hypothetical protein ABSE46_18495 [Terracidiphilus sp.]|jgi:chromosome segregation ATPase
MTLTTATTKPSKTDAATIAKLRARIGELECEAQKLEDFLTASRLRKEQLIAERAPLVRLARSQKDAEAQNRLYEIDEQLASLKRDMGDDESALAEATSQLASTRSDLSVAEWETRRKEVRECVAKHLSGEVPEAVEKAATELATLLQAAADEDQEIYARIVAFEPGLHGVAGDLRKLQKIRAEVIGFRLRNVLAIDTRGKTIVGMQDKDVPLYDRRRYADALEALDRLEPVR